MLMVITDNSNKTRYFADKYEPFGKKSDPSDFNSTSGIKLSLKTRSFSVNNQIEIPNLPLKLFEDVARHHRTEPLKIILGDSGIIGDTKGKRITVDNYAPAGENKTKLSFTQDSGITINLPVEAVDLLVANQSLNFKHPNFGGPIDLSSEDKVDELRHRYDTGELKHFTGDFGMPLNITPEGVDVILQQTEKARPNIFQQILGSLSKAFWDTAHHDTQIHRAEKPIKLADVDAHIIAQKTDKSLQNTLN